MKILENFMVLDLYYRLSASIWEWGQHLVVITINVLILICKYNHGHFNSNDDFSSIYCTYSSTTDGLIPQILSKIFCLFYYFIEMTYSIVYLHCNKIVPCSLGMIILKMLTGRNFIL